MLSFACVLSIMSCSSFLAIMMLAGRHDLRSLAIYLIIGLSGVILILNRSVRRNTWLSALLLVLLSFMIAGGIITQIRSVYASGFLWFQVLIMPAFLLCGWRPGLLVSSLIMIVALGTVGFSLEHGPVLPFDGDRLLALRTMLTTIVIINGLTLGLVAIYFYLLRENQKTNVEQKTWLQQAARMQELLQMSSHFAMKTNGPLDVIGTALHNLEEPLRRGTPPAVLLSMLGPLESGIQSVASVSRSFSLFSRRYLEEGLEQTSYNVVLQHVDTIYNVGSALRQARLHWDRREPDILIHTQTARLVMLIISVLRRVGAEGGTWMTLGPSLGKDGLQLDLSYRVGNPKETAPIPADVDVVFDPELNENLIQELCAELSVEREQRHEGEIRVYRLTMRQAQCQARVA
jgi:uncharacterized membrane protein YuzA (DUF378 family)